MNLASKNSRWEYSSDILNFLPDFVFNILIEYILIKKKRVSEQVFGKWMHFQISLSLWELQLSEIGCAWKISLKHLWAHLSLFLILKSSHRSCSIEKGVLKDFTGKHLCWNLFLIICRPEGLQHRCFPLKFEKFLRTLIFKNTCILM